MGALTNVHTPVPAARFGPHAPLRTPGTKSRRPDGLAAYRGLLDGLIRHFPVTPSGGRRRTSTSRNGRATRARSTLHRSTRPSWCSLWLVSQIVTMGKQDATKLKDAVRGGARLPAMERLGTDRPGIRIEDVLPAVMPAPAIAAELGHSLGDQLPRPPPVHSGILSTR